MKSGSQLKWAAGILTFLVVGIITRLIFSQWEEIITFPWQIQTGYLALVVIFHGIALGVTFIVWHMMVLRISGFSNIWLNFRFYYISTLAKRIPTSIPYIGGRLAMYKKAGVSGTEIINCILLENILISIAGVFTFLIFLPLYSNIPNGITFPLFFIGILLIGIIYFRPQISIEFSNKVLQKFGGHQLDKIPARSDILLWIGLYSLPWLFAGASLYFATKGFTQNISIGYFDTLEVSTLATLLSLASLLLPGGFGLKELTASTLLIYWMPFSTALIITLAYRLIHTFDEIGWALVALFVQPASFRNNTCPPKVVHLESKEKKTGD